MLRPEDCSDCPIQKTTCAAGLKNLKYISTSLTQRPAQQVNKVLAENMPAIPSECPQLNDIKKIFPNAEQYRTD